jgi:hypothetical protein
MTRDEVSREQGVALPVSSEDREAMRAARAARIARDRLAELIPKQRPAASESHRARVIASFSGGDGGDMRAARRRHALRKRCERCYAEPTHWCRGKLGFVHSERESDTPA